MDITVAFVRKIAALARIPLKEEEESKMADHMTAFLKHVEKTDQLDLSKVPETNQVTGLHSVLREDTPAPFGNEAALIQNSKHPLTDGQPTVMRVV